MAHSSQGFYVVEDNETQLWNHMILWFRIIDGAVARPLAEVAWVWYKSDGSLLGILQESLFFWRTETKLISWNLAFVKLARNFFKKRYAPSILSYCSALFCDRKKQISFMQCWQWLWECSSFEQERRVKLFFMGTPAILFFVFLIEIFFELWRNQGEGFCNGNYFLQFCSGKLICHKISTWFWLVGWVLFGGVFWISFMCSVIYRDKKYLVDSWISSWYFSYYHCLIQSQLMSSMTNSSLSDI